MQGSFDELYALVGAVQLTPGNHPTRGFAEHVRGAPTRRHHGFDFGTCKREVWTDDGTCVADAESVHPPRAASRAGRAIVARRSVAAWLEALPAGAPLLETMYPGYLLGTGDEIRDAMRLGVPLAVDVSHVFIQLRAGVMDEATWRSLERYDRVEEVHVSANDGTRDAHAPIGAATFGLAWAREKLRAGVPVVLECYMHRLGAAERRRQIDWMLGEGGVA